MFSFSSVTTQTGTNVQGGPFRGFSGMQTMTNKKDSETVMARSVLRKSWNNVNTQATIGGRGRAITPFRAVNNLGDYLGRQNYVCGGSNQVNASKPGMKGLIGSINSQCDGTGIAASVTNNRFVADSSDYIKYKKQNAMNRNYNDLATGGIKSSFQHLPLNMQKY